ncbi:hypothetical protein CLV98_1412 [Dyadobacter jejuensis]|uniref:Uncharacterized protein n=1 Tax=Dyadobacter jejuensis TaxID=1082580 RepID=A0A315ZY75_9BACT|nr:hypothetical protein [Dyadobacter jejuensis]PWJ50621.1 hypothetical protein CLV98_1412 [Dyadobacter jejuensis]
MNSKQQFIAGKPFLGEKMLFARFKYEHSSRTILIQYDLNTPWMHYGNAECLENEFMFCVPVVGIQNIWGKVSYDELQFQETV